MMIPWPRYTEFLVEWLFLCILIGSCFKRDVFSKKLCSLASRIRTDGGRKVRIDHMQDHPDVKSPD